MSVTLRSIDPDELAELHRLVASSEIQDQVPFISSLTEIESWLADPHFSLERDLRVAERNGAMLGWGRVLHHPSGERLERAHLLGGTHSAHRGEGVGSIIFRWQLDHARQRLAAYDHDLPRFIRTFQYDHVVDAISLYERHGLVPARWFNELIRELEDLPTGRSDVEIVGWDRRLDAAVLVVKNAAFADHWGSTPNDDATWASWLDDPATRLDLSFIARSEDEVIGYLLSEHFPWDEEASGRRDGWITSLGVVKPWRGRGVARSLIATALHAYRAVGFTHAMLGVDSENPTGAMGLYTGLGFRPLHRLVTHEVEITS